MRNPAADQVAMPHEFDAAIQYGYGNWPSANARYLIGKETSIVCSPQLRDALPLRTPQDLICATARGRTVPMLSPRLQPWPVDWSNAMEAPGMA